MSIKKRQTATLSLIASLGPFQFDTYLPALPALMLFMHTSDTMVQLTITASLLGMASGQLFVGPLIDALGRRRPLLIALSVFILASIGCLTATDVTWMIVARFILGFSAASGFVINNAFIRDVAVGGNASRLYSTQAAITSLAPVVAPLVGGQLLLLGDWHVVFIFLTIMGVAVLGMAAWLMPETLAVEKRSKLSFKATFAAWGGILRDSRFVALAVTGGLLFGQVCVFISGAPFALERGFHLTPTEYTFAFAAVTIVMFSANTLNRSLLKKFASVNLLRYGLSQGIFAALFMTALNLWNIHTLPLSIVGFALSISAMGFCMANIMGLAMRDHAERAGTAAGLMGFSNSIGGAVAAPLTGLIFGLDIVGVTVFMSILLVAAAVVGLIGTRKEKAVLH
ncbi:MAG: Bicyclomycin resistance protein [Actinomycetota bacterium]|jgi:DHA1 family bicyclomycin/chloramphenicol resistance-like MFS transporter